jgi:hypothetical protein
MYVFRLYRGEIMNRDKIEVTKKTSWLGIDPDLPKWNESKDRAKFRNE